MKASVEIEDVTVHYGAVRAVEAASFEVQAGSFAALVGPSGCGKTSLLRAIAGFESPAGGTVRIDGVVVAGNGIHVPPEKRQIGMMFQEGALFPHLDILGNVSFGATKERARAMLALVGMEALASRYPHELSGGQQQRVALARALAPSPRVILLDEPFDGLDAALRVRIREEVRQILAAAETTAILVTHDQEEALSMAEQVSVMSAGRILQTSSPREIYEHPESVAVAEIIGDALLLEAIIANGIIVTPFGTLRSSLADGKCVVRFRSEDLHIAESGGASGVVTATHFFGHDAVDEVKLTNGRLVRVRMRQSTTTPGDAVHLGIAAKSLRVFLASGGAVDVPVQRLSAVG